MPREQDQFLDVVDRDTAERRWWDAARPEILPTEPVALGEALGRILAVDVASGVDVPAFDRSNVDGYAVRAEDTYRAAEEEPRRLALNPEEVATGVVPGLALGPGTATPIATGGMVPRGADAIVMVEHATIVGDTIAVARPVAPGSGVSFAGTDIARGELVLRRATRLTSRETGVLAAIGRAEVDVIRRPRVAIGSTGDEVVAPGAVPGPASVFDANATALADAVRELGGEPIALGIIPDDPAALNSALDRGLAAADLIILSGGTSKGAGDQSYRALAGRSPGVVVHGVALKPGKPICLGVVGATPVAILPGFPTSAMMTFHELIAPLIRKLAGAHLDDRDAIPARMPARFNSEVGRTEYLLVNLIDGPAEPLAYPIGKGSGSIMTFARADGFVTIPRNREYIEAGEAVAVVPIGRGTRPADLVTIGSHCTGLDALLGELTDAGYATKSIAVGSQGGLAAAARGECDVAGIHLLDDASGLYNRPFLAPGVGLVEGYGRMQGVAFRPGDARFEGFDVADAINRSTADPDCRMINRNRGSGTRAVIDRLLGGRRPPGYAVEARSHNAVAAALAQGRADWGLAIGPVAALYGLSFLPVLEERYDFAIPDARRGRPAVEAFVDLFDRAEVRGRLARLGFAARGRGPNPLGAIVLCGGQSRRMGRSKAWLPFGPETMLGRVVRLVGSVAGEVVVVAAPGQDLPSLPADTIIVRDPAPDRGPLQGLAAGLAALGPTSTWAYATATDAAALEPAWILALQRLVGDHDLAIPSAGGYHHPLAALYRRSAALPAVEALLREDRLRPVFLMDAIRTRVVEAEELERVDPGLKTLRNLNTPADYRAALADAGWPTRGDDRA